MLVEVTHPENRHKAEQTMRFRAAIGALLHKGGSHERASKKGLQGVGMEDTLRVGVGIFLPRESAMANIRTMKSVFGALLAVGTFVAVETAEAGPKQFSEYNRYDHGRRYRPGHRARPNSNVPELSVGASAAALGLLGGGLMVITGRRRQKRG
jgi:hypothetical protein